MSFYKNLVTWKKISSIYSQRKIFFELNSFFIQKMFLNVNKSISLDPKKIF